MKSLVIYDSVFGNTEKIAQSIGNALGAFMSVEVLKAETVKSGHISGVDLIIAGSPTRIFKPTAAMIRFLKNLPENSLKGIPAAAFDTRMTAESIASSPPILRFMVKRFGYAAGSIASRLKKKGGNLLLAEGFFVEDTEGPLRDDELKRAADWAERLVQKLSGNTGN